MRPSIALANYREQIKSVVLNHHATNVRIFGSVVQGKDTDTSDLDLLIDPTSETSLMDIGAIRCELKALLGVNVDVLTPKALPDSFRDQVLKESIPL
ncbi:MAG: nucleotidyltransferase family protein [Methylococcales bacterium]|nr:nucleotidyltransferase family protein [Methylococcales bacterium]